MGILEDVTAKLGLKDSKQLLLIAGGAAVLGALILSSKSKAPKDASRATRQEAGSVDVTSKEGLLHVLKEMSSTQAESRKKLTELATEAQARSMSLSQTCSRYSSMQIADPLDKYKLSMVDFNRILSQYEDDAAIQDAIMVLMGAPKGGVAAATEAAASLSAKKLIDIHAFMLQEFEKLASSKDKGSSDPKILTFAAQALVAGKTEQAFKVSPEDIENAVLAQQGALIASTEFSDINMKMQQAMTKLVDDELVDLARAVFQKFDEAEAAWNSTHEVALVAMNESTLAAENLSRAFNQSISGFEEGLDKVETVGASALSAQDETTATQEEASLTSGLTEEAVQESEGIQNVLGTLNSSLAEIHVPSCCEKVNQSALAAKAAQAELAALQASGASQTDISAAEEKLANATQAAIEASTKCVPLDPVDDTGSVASVEESQNAVKNYKAHSSSLQAEIETVLASLGFSLSTPADIQALQNQISAASSENVSASDDDPFPGATNDELTKKIETLQGEQAATEAQAAAARMAALQAKLNGTLKAREAGSADPSHRQAELDGEAQALQTQLNSLLRVQVIEAEILGAQRQLKASSVIVASASRDVASNASEETAAIPISMDELIAMNEKEFTALDTLADQVDKDVDV